MKDCIKTHTHRENASTIKRCLAEKTKKKGNLKECIAYAVKYTFSATAHDDKWIEDKYYLLR